LWLHSLKVAQLLRSAACLHTNQSRSYLNHLVINTNYIHPKLPPEIYTPETTSRNIYTLNYLPRYIHPKLPPEIYTPETTSRNIYTRNYLPKYIHPKLPPEIYSYTPETTSRDIYTRNYLPKYEYIHPKLPSEFPHDVWQTGCDTHSI